MMLLLLWLFCGGLVGLVAALAFGSDRRQGVLVGLVAAAVGGALFSAFGLFAFGFAGAGLSDAITRSSSSTALVLALVAGVVIAAGWQIIVRARA